MAKSDSDARRVTKSITQTGTQQAAQIGDGTQTVTFNSANRTLPERLMYFTVGVFLLLVAVGMAIWGFKLGTLTPDQRQILLWALPLASGFGCGSFAGGMTAKGKGLIPGLIVTATGGFAVWLITIFVLFPK
jgi:hypothetical protein